VDSKNLYGKKRIYINCFSGPYKVGLLIVNALTPILELVWCKTQYPMFSLFFLYFSGEEVGAIRYKLVPRHCPLSGSRGKGRGRERVRGEGRVSLNILQNNEVVSVQWRVKEGRRAGRARDRDYWCCATWCTYCCAVTRAACALRLVRVCVLRACREKRYQDIARLNGIR
jgi:hypothetical protein